VTALRVMTYNVRSLRDDEAAVARVIRAAEPHIVCIQEAPRFLRSRTRAAALARRSGLVVLAGGRGAAGNLLLCDLAIDVERAAVLRFSHRQGTHRRGAAVAVCRLAGHRFGIAGTHLDLAAADRELHTRELLDRLPAEGVGAGVPAIIGGDLNAEPGSPTWELFTAQLTDTGAAAAAATYPASSPRTRIDAIFADPGLAVRAARVLDGPDVQVGSDHRPFLAELDLGPAGP
jgi:endonuclease/exonuclease/phosphatase family metal-dependent hydrolase